MATGPATWAYRDRFGESFGRTYFRRYGDGVVSSIGLGTYLGDPTDDRDRAYREVITEALESGVNVVDTATNYRTGRSERVVGEAVDRAEVRRESVLVASKAGFVPFEGNPPEDPGRYVREEFVETGLLDRDDLAKGAHALAPAFVDAMVDRSLSALSFDTVDLYYIHNPETQLEVRSHEAVYDQLEAAFEVLERRRLAGDIGAYGVATWDAFRVAPDDDAYLSLPEVVRRARAAADTVGAETTGVAAVQLPFNVVMADAFTIDAHEGPDGRQSALEFAHEAGLSVFTSASIAQGRLAEGLPDAVAARVAGDTPAQRAINFARSAPGVTASLVGTGTRDHLRENVDAGRFDPLGANAFDAVFE
jgi:aryl-alcohol dehydrogenase-like predicted oxidoreductase